YRFWRSARDAGIDACLLAVADYLTASGVHLNTTEWTLFLETIGQLFAGYDRAMHVKPLLNGHDLIQTFKVRQGAYLGKLLEIIRELQALGEITSTEEAMTYAKAWLNNEID
ncbi:MAG TPA: hypothetical protein VJZ27_09440, partial [Aggregatilineales bacterium]|nr:hypothetical protein [Aggregatilineales bacterium]